MTPFISARISCRQQRTGAALTQEGLKELARRGCVSHTAHQVHCEGVPQGQQEINDGALDSRRCEVMHDQTRIILEHSGTILLRCIH